MTYAYSQPASQINVQVSAFDALLSASPVVQLTLMLLITLSVTCWAIILTKRKQFREISRDNKSFLDAFWKTQSLDHLNETTATFATSTVARVFKAGFYEMQKIAESNLAHKPAQKGDLAPRSLQLSGIDNLARALQKSSDREINTMEKYLTELATTGSTGPFIGLFGTVWGIMSAFEKIGATGSASLAVVAPGISEALITTAIGLVAAIPAVVAYNHFLSLMKREELEIEGFCTDFLNIAKRNFFKGN